MGLPVKVRFNEGYVSARPREELRNGELQTATGIYYRPGDTFRAHKIGGRGTYADTGSAAEVKGLYLAQFDGGTGDKLLAFAGSVIDSGTPGSSGSFTNLVTGLSGTTFCGVHYNNRHYLCTGADVNRVLETDGSVRAWGMFPPQVRPVGVSAAVTQVLTRPTAETFTVIASVEGWANTAAAYDTDMDTFGYVRVSAAEIYTGAKQHEWHTWGADTNAGRRLAVRFRVTSSHVKGNTGEDIGAGGGRAGRFRVRAIITYSTDGSTYGNTLLSAIYERSMTDAETLQVPITVNSNLIKVKASLQVLSTGEPVQLQIADVRIERGGAASNVSTTTGIFGAFTEYDAARDLESGPSPVSAIVTMSAANQITWTLPAAAQNATSTHWRFYMTPDGGTAPSQLGRVATIPIAQTSYVHTFDLFAFDFQAAPIIKLVTTAGTGGTLYWVKDAPPPVLKFVWTHRGRILGINAASTRALAFSEAGFPESWPEINSDNDFPLQEGDSLVCGASVGDVCVVFCSMTVITMLDVASWVDGTFRMTRKSVLTGAPGCVGYKAMTRLDSGGISGAAWVSRHGIYVTDGHTAKRISDDIDWTQDLPVSSLATAVLHWDRNRQCLVFAYDADGDGLNDRFFLFHMDPAHEKANGMPKVTGPHYASIASMASGIVSGSPLLWSGHVDSGIVYTEEAGATDASQSYSGTQVPLIVKTGRLYGDNLAPGAMWRDFGMFKGRLRHGNWGGGATMSVQAQTGRDSTGVTQTVTKTVGLANQDADEFFIGVGGEWCEITMTHVAAAQSWVNDLVLDVQVMGRSGRVA